MAPAASASLALMLLLICVYACLVELRWMQTTYLTLSSDRLSEPTEELDKS